MNCSGKNNRAANYYCPVIIILFAFEVFARDINIKVRGGEGSTGMNVSVFLVCPAAAVSLFGDEHFAGIIIVYDLSF